MLFMTAVSACVFVMLVSRAPTAVSAHNVSLESTSPILAVQQYHWMIFAAKMLFMTAIFPGVSAVRDTPLRGAIRDVNRVRLGITRKYRKTRFATNAMSVFIWISWAALREKTAYSVPCTPAV